MAESKSDEYANKIKDLSEFSSFIDPLTALRNFPRSERRRLLADPRPEGPCRRQSRSARRGMRPERRRRAAGFQLEQATADRCDGLSLMAWSRRFDEPIELPDGRKLRTLKEATESAGRVS